MRISDWSSDVCSSDLRHGSPPDRGRDCWAWHSSHRTRRAQRTGFPEAGQRQFFAPLRPGKPARSALSIREYGTNLLSRLRSEEHTSELQSLMRISSSVLCLKKTNNTHLYKTR